MALLKLFKQKLSPNITETPGEVAGRLYDEGLNCAQAVLQATTGRDDTELLTMAKAFGGGIGGAKCLCGAVAGGVMALGLKGKGRRSGKLVKAFRKQHRITCCAGLTAQYSWKSHEHLASCRRLTVATAELVVELAGGLEE